jgi:hypothetical protein
MNPSAKQPNTHQAQPNEFNTEPKTTMQKMMSRTSQARNRDETSLKEQ